MLTVAWRLDRISRVTDHKELFKEARRSASQLMANLSKIKTELDVDSVRKYVSRAQGLVNDIEHLLKNAEKGIKNGPQD